LHDRIPSSALPPLHVRDLIIPAGNDFSRIATIGAALPSFDRSGRVTCPNDGLKRRYGDLGRAAIAAPNASACAVAKAQSKGTMGNFGQAEQQ
jgi:hypothetical protein